jgi:hypothetical protein
MLWIYSGITSFSFLTSYSDLTSLYFTSYRCLFQELQIQTQSQSIRQKCYQLINEIFCQSEYLYNTLIIKNEYIIKGVIESISGEKDPRCLVLCFDIIFQLQVRIMYS